MARETEHKYIVVSDLYREMAESVLDISQGYLNREPERTVRIRTFGDKGYVTVKGKTTEDTRLEFEYEIPFADAREMLELCEADVIIKKRWIVPFEGHVWEVDEFFGDLEGLTVAEIELTASTHDYKLPPFVGREVTGDKRWYNSQLHRYADELRAELRAESQKPGE